MKNLEARRLSTLLESIAGAEICGDTAIPITGVTDDSRFVEPGNLFCAVQGTRVNGESFIEEAIHRGASAILSRTSRPSPVPVIVVENPRKTLGILYSAWFDHPSRELEMIATTGTDGKTSVAYIISRMMFHSGARCGYIGTLGAFTDDRSFDSSHTTPPPLILHRILREMVDDSCRAVSMEASSHGLKQDRLSGIALHCAVFTTFGRDHLDYHESSEDYLNAKLSIFRHLGRHGTAVVNNRFPEIIDTARRLSPRIITFSAIPENTDITVERIGKSGNSHCIFLRHESRRFTIRTKLRGTFQIENITAAAGAGIALGLDYEEICRGIESVDFIPGRFEPVYRKGRLRAIIDYAHTPEALKNALRSARALTSGRLIVVFGCGGDRDTGKRPLMGRIAEQLADIVIVTSDNPRSEDPESIIADIMTGMKSPTDTITKNNRRDAIEEAISCSQAGDIVLIAGKGHEKTQTIGTDVHPFDDCEITRKILETEGNGP